MVICKGQSLGKSGTNNEWDTERDSEGNKKAPLGPPSQRHKSKRSQLNSNANPVPSNQRKSQPQFSQVPVCARYPKLTGTPHSPHGVFLNACVLNGVGAVPHNMHAPLCTSLPIPILLFLFPPPSPSSKGVRNEPELIESQKQLPRQVQWGRSSCRGSGRLPREGGEGVEDDRLGSPGGCQGAACWLLGSSLAIGSVLKPLGCLTI